MALPPKPACSLCEVGVVYSVSMWKLEAESQSILVVLFRRSRYDFFNGLGFLLPQVALRVTYSHTVGLLWVGCQLLGCDAWVFVYAGLKRCIAVATR